MRLPQMQADCLLLESQLISSRSTTTEQNTNVSICGERNAFDFLVQRYTYLKKYVSHERDNALCYKFSNGFNVYSHNTSRTKAIEGWKTLYKQMCRNGDFEDCKYEGLRYTQQKHEIFKQNDDNAR